MKKIMKALTKHSLVILLLFQIACTSTEDFEVMRQITGPIETNCYLIYGTKSRDAALIDPGGQIDTLLAFINENELELKYIFLTHGHIDHVYGIPEILNQFPNAKMCMHEAEYIDLFTQLEWAIENYGPGWLAQCKSNPELAKFLEFDMKSLGEPEIFVEDNQIFKLGFMEIGAIHCPGHAPGQVCYYTDSILFSGDVLFYRNVGRTDTQHGSREDQIKSVQKLYELFPDDTKVYPGHGQFTDIGSEKTENQRITLTGGEWVIN
ncbi:MAG: MBL fold metallo-hydrolase [Bacteroidales bacterium]|nr:MBL fold metallo-hydrolase [Bacteroidales bacterium]